MISVILLSIVNSLDSLISEIKMELSFLLVLG